MNHYHLFETAIGWAGLAWADQGLIGAHLPERDKEVARASFKRRHRDLNPAEPTPELATLVEGICALMRGEKADIAWAPVDFARVPDFDARVYQATRLIPPGATQTYGEIALSLGDKSLAQQVGAALGRNPWPIVVPCHRVTAANGKLGGFTARGGIMTKLKLLEIEGAKAAGQPDLFGR